MISFGGFLEEWLPCLSNCWGLLRKTREDRAIQPMEAGWLSFTMKPISRHINAGPLNGEWPSFRHYWGVFCVYVLLIAILLEGRSWNCFTGLLGNFSLMANPLLKIGFILLFSPKRNIFGFHQKVDIMPIFRHLPSVIGDPNPPWAHGVGRKILKTSCFSRNEVGGHITVPL